MEYTLQDTYEDLKELESERQRELDQLAVSIANNRISSLNPNAISDQVGQRKLKYVRHFLENLARKEPSDYPAHGTAHLRLEVLKQLKKETKQMEELQKSLQAELADIQEDTTYLRKKRDGLAEMKQANLKASTTPLSGTHPEELVILNRIFRETKNGLRDVVSVLFPDNDQMMDLLADLSAAFTKGGDDIYVDVLPDMQDCVALLIEHDIIHFHKHDNTKVKLTEML